MKGHFSHIAMIQSKTNSAKKQISPILKHKSPKKQFENINNLNMMMQSPKRQSLSPLKFRKKKNSSMQKSKQLFKSQEKLCTNHSNKVGNFSIESQFEIFYYCKSCAVRLASQGFDVKAVLEKVNILSLNKFDQESDHENQRVEQINNFVGDLQFVIEDLNYKKIEINTSVMKGNSALENQVTKIKQYYSQFYQIISEHENRVIEELKRQYEVTLKSIYNFADKVEQALQNSQLMKKDIIQSINEVVLEAPDVEFRPIMLHYQQNLLYFKKLCSEKEKEIKIKALSFRDSEAVCQLLLQNMQIQWEDENKKHNSNQDQESFSFQFERFLSSRKQKRKNTLLGSKRSE